MEELIPIIIIFVVSSIVSSLKKNQKSAEAQRRHAAATSRMQPPQRQAQPITAPARPVADVPAQVITPTVHLHLTPDCETHDTAGSLGVTSMEGKDHCHEDQLTHVRTPEETVTPEQGGLTFDWTGSNMVKAIVMQEVLTRPAQRRAR